MESTSIYWIIGVIILFGIIIDILTPKIKGWIGEATVASILSKLPKEEYITINNVMLHTAHGTTQIDHIVVSIYGIFVIETKNYRGWITGSDNSEQWVKNMYGKKYSFRNPIKQNWGHVKALEDLLNKSADYFIPIIVFSNSASLKVKTNNLVIYTSKLKKVIKSYNKILIDNQELESTVRTINESNIDSRENRKKHVSNIHKNLSKQKKLINSEICPRCGGALVKRKGKYGVFWGCRNYPKCRFTK